jgi:hypothetical protein
MGKSPQGAYGSTNGKIGKLVSYKLRGEDVTRMAGVTTKKRSILQLAGSQRLTVVNAFLKPIKGFINLGFKFKSEGTIRHQYSLATSCNMINAVDGEYPFLKMAYSKVIVSEGELTPAYKLKVSKNDKAIKIKWFYDQKMDYENRNDRAMILLIYPSGKDPIYILSGSLRSEGCQNIKLNTDLVLEPCHIYVSFLAENRDSVSTSTYVYVS